MQNDLMEWLHLLNLMEYGQTLMAEGYKDLESVTDITWEDLEEIGIKKLGKDGAFLLNDSVGCDCRISFRSPEENHVGH